MKIILCLSTVNLDVSQDLSTEGELQVKGCNRSASLSTNASSIENTNCIFSQWLHMELPQNVTLGPIHLPRPIPLAPFAPLSTTTILTMCLLSGDVIVNVLIANNSVEAFREQFHLQKINNNNNNSAEHVCKEFVWNDNRSMIERELEESNELQIILEGRHALNEIVIDLLEIKTNGT